MHQSLLPYTPERDAYRLLGVPASASPDEISAACRRLARTFHPDRNLSARANAEMQVVNTVRRVMSDPHTRALYDRERMRFHDVRVRVTSLQSRPLVQRVPVARLPAPPTPIERYARATAIGVRAAITELLPSRCDRCHAVPLSDDDAYCAGCGARLHPAG